MEGNENMSGLEQIERSGVSVIVPAYNARKYLGECLTSIGRQTLRPCEVLVVDDASPEPFDEIVDLFAKTEGAPPVRLIRHEINRGQASGRNTGMKESSGEWLAFIDSDDMWDPGHLESVVSAALSGEADLGFCPAILFREDPHDPRNYRLRPLTQDEKAIRPLAFLKRCFIITSSVVVRAETLKSVDGFDESPGLRGVEDLDCFMRLLRKGATFRMADRATLFYRKHDESATGVMGYLSRQDIRAKKLHIEWPEGSRAEKRRIMIDSHWRAAVKLWLAGAPDRIAWFFRALAVSAPEPLLGCRWVARFVRALIRRSADGL